jgi:hypothetical protein
MYIVMLGVSDGIPSSDLAQSGDHLFLHRVSDREVHLPLYKPTSSYDKDVRCVDAIARHIGGQVILELSGGATIDVEIKTCKDDMINPAIHHQPLAQLAGDSYMELVASVGAAVVRGHWRGLLVGLPNRTPWPRPSNSWLEIRQWPWNIASAWNSCCLIVRREDDGS